MRAIHGIGAIAYGHGRDVGIPESGREDLHAAERQGGYGKALPFLNSSASGARCRPLRRDRTEARHKGASKYGMLKMAKVSQGDPTAFRTSTPQPNAPARRSDRQVRNERYAGLTVPCLRGVVLRLRVFPSADGRTREPPGHGDSHSASIRGRGERLQMRNCGLPGKAGLIEGGLVLMLAWRNS